MLVAAGMTALTAACGQSLDASPTPESNGLQLHASAAIDGEGGVQWSQFGDSTPYQRVTVDGAGNIYGLRLTFPLGNTLVLEKRCPRGGLVYSKSYPVAANRMVNLYEFEASADGAVYLHLSTYCLNECGDLDLGSGPVPEFALIKFTTDAAVEWQQEVHTGTGASGVDFGVDGSVLLLENSRLTRLSPSGTPEWSRPMGVQAAAFDREGNILLGRSIGIAKLTPGGDFLWETRFGNLDKSFVYVNALDATALGTVVVKASYSGTPSWGPFTLPAPDQGPPPHDGPSPENGVLLAAESYGAPRFATPVGAALDQMTVDSAGRVFLRGYKTVSKFNLEGKPVWKRELGFHPASIAATQDHGVIVAGTISQAINVGGTIIDPQGETKAVLIKLGP